MSFLSKIIDEDIFLDKRNQTPIPEKINKIEWKKKESWIVVLVCSATESTKGSIVVKNGLIAFRYRKLAPPIELVGFVITKNELISIIEINNNNPFLILFLSLLTF